MIATAQLVTLLGAAAASLHVIGYFTYLRDPEIEPNPLTWMMFSYGTVLLTLLEWDSDASGAELLLPLVCSAMAIYVAIVCWRRARRRNPRSLFPREWFSHDWRDRAAFQADVALTICYIGASLLMGTDWIDRDLKEVAVFTFLVAANLTTFSAFFPLIRGVLENPEVERTTPWAIWAGAYGLLALTTFASNGTVFSHLMLYPVLNATLHGSVAFLSRPSRRASFAPMPA